MKRSTLTKFHRQLSIDTTGSTSMTYKEIAKYPNNKINTVLNICPQGYAMIIEGFGKYKYTQGPGLFLTVPIYHDITVFDTRELVLGVYKQYGHTSDNVMIGIAAQIYLQIIDPYKACYAVKQPLVAVVAHAQSIMRSSIGKYDLDHLLRDRVSINRDVHNALSASADSWGIKVNRIEITDLTPDEKVAKSMDLQATSERERRQTEKNAEASKRAMELESEGYKQKLINEAEGRKLQVINEAEGRAQSINIETKAEMDSITEYAKCGLNPRDILQYRTTLKYLDMMRSIASNGAKHTFFIGKDISNTNAMTKNIIDFISNKNDLTRDD